MNEVQTTTRSGARDEAYAEFFFRLDYVDDAKALVGSDAVVQAESDDLSRIEVISAQDAQSDFGDVVEPDHADRAGKSSQGQLDLAELAARQRSAGLVGIDPGRSESDDPQE